MKKKIISIIAILTFTIIGSGLFSMIFPQNVNAAASIGQGTNPKCPNTAFLGFKTWYSGLQNDGDCTIISPSDTAIGGIQPYILKVIMNVADIIIMVVGYIAFFFVLYGGIQFVISQGNADKMAKARMTIMNALIGIVIASTSVIIVRFSLDGLIGAGNANSSGASFEDVLNGALNIFYFITGAVAVITIIISSFTMVTVGNKADSVAKARNSILYASIGIVIIVFAKTITWFILKRF